LKNGIFILLCLITGLNCATNRVSGVSVKVLDFSVIYNGEDFKLGDSLQFNKDYIIIKKLKFYISNIQLSRKNKLVWAMKNSYSLLNLEDPNSLTIEMNIPSKLKFDQLKFGLGIDSLTNDNGIGPDDLDPLKGMYWTWNTGYINFKIEGKSSLCKHSSKTFNLHLGGFLDKQLAYQEQVFNVNDKQNLIKAHLDLKKIFDSINLSIDHTLMSAGPRSVQISKLIASSFSIN